MFKVNDMVTIAVHDQLVSATVIQVRKRLWWIVYDVRYVKSVLGDDGKEKYTMDIVTTRTGKQIYGLAKS